MTRFADGPVPRKTAAGKADRLPTARTWSPPALSLSILNLQRTVGNAAVVQLIARSTDTSSSPASMPTLPPVVDERDDRTADDDEVLGEAARQAQRVEDAAAETYAQVDSSAAEQRARLAETFAAQQTEADAGLRGLVGRVRSDAAAQSRAVTTAAGGARRQIQEKAGTADQAAGQRVDDMAGQVRQHADAQADRATSSAVGRVGSIGQVGGAADADVAAGQRRIRDAVTGRTRTELARSGASTAGHVRSRAAERQGKVYGPARSQAGEQIRANARQADAAIAGGEATATAAVSHAGTHAQTSAANAYRLMAQGLAAGQRAARSQLDNWATAAKERIRGAAQRFSAALTQHGAVLAKLVAPRRPAASARAVAAVQQGGDEVIAAIADTAGGIRSGTTQLAEAHHGAVAGVGGQVASALGRVGDAASQVLGRQAAAFTRQTEQATASAVAELQQAPTRTAGALASEHSRGLAEVSGAVERAAQTETAWTADAASRMQAGGSRYAHEAERLGSEAQQAPVQRLFDGLINRMRSWLRSKLGDVLGGIVSGIILSLPAIAVAVGLLFAGPVGWGVLAGLLIVGAGLGIYGRFSEYRADHGGRGPGLLEGIALVGLGIADITGLPYIVEALAGRRAFAPQPMSEFEQWERGTQGLINLALVVAGGAKKLFGRGGVGERVPAPAPGERGPAGPAPGERVPGSDTPPARPPVTKGRMTELIREIESGRPIEFTTEHAEALRMNAELASQKWVNIHESQGRVPWDSIRNQLQLSRWQFLPRAPEAAQVLRNALMRLPDGPERAEMLRLLDGWLGGADAPTSGGGTPVPVPVPGPPHEGDED